MRVLVQAMQRGECAVVTKVAKTEVDPSAGSLPPWFDGSVSGTTKRNPGTVRPLLIAEAANPEWTSVPLVGWNLTRAIARQTGALVATQIRNREAFLRAGLREGIDFIAIDNERQASRLHRIGEVLRGGDNKGWTAVTALSSIAYYSFEKQLWRVLKGRLTEGEFSLVHRVTPVSPTSQSAIAKKLKSINVPFVVGPMNGGVAWPPAFRSVRRQELDWLSPMRRLHKLMPHYSATRHLAAALIAGSRATFDELPKSCLSKSFWLPENAVEPDRFPFTQRRRDSGPLRIAFVGRLVPYKGADILIEAVASCHNSRDLEIVIIGDGPQRPLLEALVRTHGLEGRVQFRGWIPQERLAHALADSHVLALPSVREFGGGVVVEAMSLGIVPVVADYAGPPELIDIQCGIAVKFHDRHSLVQGFANALVSLGNAPERLASMSCAAASRARLIFTWDAKAKQILQVYEWVRGNAAKPSVNLTVPVYKDKEDYDLLNQM